MAATDTRSRIIETSAELFRRQGYIGTGVKRIAEDAGTPFGSLYHFFPGGKEELADAVIRHAGAFYLRLFETIADGSPDIGTGVQAFFVGAAETLRATDYADACPIATVALEVASTNDGLRRATDDVFESWIAALSSRLNASGIASARSRELAIEAVCALEGAFILSRAARTTEAVEIAGRTTVASIRAALPRRKRATR